MKTLSFVAVCTVCVLVAFPGHSSAQAWTPRQGEGEVSLVYQDLFTREHLFGDGSRIDIGHIRLLGLITSVDFGATDKLAISASLPVGVGKYNGAFPHQLPIDNGNYHGTVQDFRASVRYQVRRGEFVLTPFVGTTWPSHQYEDFAHSAIGSHMRELVFGTNVGRRLGGRLSKAYFQARYGFVISEKFAGVRPNRSRIDGELGYFVTPRLGVRALLNSQFTHGGLDYPQDFPSRTDERWRHHDQISRIDLIDVGGGFSFSLTDRWDIFSSLVTTTWGRNGHALASGLTIGISRSFRTRRAATLSAQADGPEKIWRNEVPANMQTACNGH